MTIGLMNAIITERSRDARVVELADSLDSGSSAHSGRAGSSPASRTSIVVSFLLATIFLPRFSIQCWAIINIFSGRAFD